MPALAPEPQPVAALRARSGPPRSRACPQDVEPRGQTLMEDGSVADGWDGWMDGWRKVGGRHAGPGGGAGVWGPLQGWPGAAGVPGVAGPPSCVGGGGIPRWFSWWPGCVPGAFWSLGGALAPVPRPLLRVLAGPSPPLPAPPPRPVCATACVPFRHPCSPRSGTELASPHVGVVSRPLSAGGVPGWSSALGALRGGRGGGALVCTVGLRVRGLWGPPVRGGRAFSRAGCGSRL